MDLLNYMYGSMDGIIHDVEKPTGYPGEYCPLGFPRPKTRGAGGPKGFWPYNLPRDNIHQYSPKAFSHNTILP